LILKSFFHLAATFERSEESYDFFQKNFHHNLKLSHTLLDIAKNLPQLEKIIFASSYLIYDPKQYMEKDKVVKLSEKSPINPRNICGAAKLFHELELNFFTHFLPKTSLISARIFRVFGRNSQDIISRWIQQAHMEEELTVYKAQGSFDYIFADDVAEGLLHLAKTSFSGVVNLGSGKSQTIFDVLKELKKHFPKLKTKEIPSDILCEKSEADMELFQSLTGWIPPHTLSIAIPKLIEHVKQKPPIAPIKKGVLITSISKKIPLIESVKNALSNFTDFSFIHGSDSNKDCIGKHFIDHFWQSPPLDKLTIEEVIQYCKNHHITAIIPTRDADLEYFSKYKTKLHQNGITTLVSDQKTVNLCLDKKKFSDFLIEKGIPAIITKESINEIKADRLVAKMRFGAGSKGILLNKTKEEVLQEAKQLENPIFQPFIEGKEWSLDLYRDLKGHVQGCVARERNVIVQGESQITTTANYPKLEKLGIEIAEALSIYGHAVIQIIEDTHHNFHVIECNLRFGGASSASVSVGLNSFLWFFAETLGLDLNHYPFKRRQEQICQIRYPKDKIIFIRHLA